METSYTQWDIWLLYFVGQFFHLLAQSLAVAHAKNNPISSVFGVCRDRLKGILVRLFLGTMLFMAVWAHPDIVPEALKYVGVALSSNATKLSSLPMSLWVAGLFGFGVDSVISFITDRIPRLRREVPSGSESGGSNG